MGSRRNGIQHRSVTVGPAPAAAFSSFILLVDHTSPTDATQTWRTFGPLSLPENKKALATMLREHADRIDPLDILVPPRQGLFIPTN